MSWSHLIFLTEPEAWNDKAHWSKDGCHFTNAKNQNSDTDIEPLCVGLKVDLILVREPEFISPSRYSNTSTDSTSYRASQNGYATLDS